ncbi:uncharacterized protein LOC124151211 isoform X2 [Haliotis rufescens]|uniref:uncharacterized protein LOC124151211 isoform X2 n=1 Tax=Haliotis rufescens TaxID=6454 RepID=UPI00201F7646|nr:uncharacterized protein LOC124151211 isoform X2 [Haliotis rufescens]
MAAVAAQQSSDVHAAYKPRRTQAMPKNSLFGTSLEMRDGEEQHQQVAEAVTPYVSVRQDNDILRHKRADFEHQKGVVRKSQSDLKSAEDKALTFSPDPRTTGTGSMTSGSKNGQMDKAHQWFTQKDIEHAKDMNVGGLTATGSYNRDKYGRKPKVHSYSQMGDILYPGMEFTPRQGNDVNQNGNFSKKKSQPSTNITNDLEEQTTAGQSAPRSVIAIPANIRHKYGSSVCDALFSDEVTVADSIARQEKLEAPVQNRRPVQAGVFKKNDNPEYDLLSNATRQNVFPGYTSGHKISTTKTVYNDKIFSERYQDPEEYRYQRDELSKWAEHNVLRERMKKAWDRKALEGGKKE